MLAPRHCEFVRKVTPDHEYMHRFYKEERTAVHCVPEPAQKLAEANLDAHGYSNRKAENEYKCSWLYHKA